MDNPKTTPETNTQKTFSYPDQIRGQAEQTASTVKIILEIPKSISVLRRVFRGEALMQSEDGSSTWIQVVKPVFIKLDPITRQPIMKPVKMIDGTVQDFFTPNDEAIEEILSQLSFMGMNPITALTNLSPDNILDDLKEFECKLAGILCLKQVEWGLDKALMPMIMTKIKTIIQDARYMCANGNTLRALSQQVSRIEQVIEGDRTKKINSPYT